MRFTSVIWVVHAAYQILQEFAHLFFTAAHQQGVFEGVLRELVELLHVFLHHFHFFGARYDAAVVAVPFGHGGHIHDTGL